MLHPNYSYSILASSIALACASPALAQSADGALPEVIVTGYRTSDGQLQSTRAGGYIAAPLLDTPFSVHVLSQAMIQDLRLRQSSDAMKFDASVNEAYNAVGYAEQFSIRGFALDNASGYRKDGFAIPGDASIPLENKERIEILKGVAGFQAGFAAPGGIVNYVSKRPTAAPLRSAVVELSERGTLYGAADLGGMTGDRQFGYRINVAGERLRSYIKGADGERQFVSGAFDWQLTPQALLQLDLDYQHKSQLSAPGFQLTNGSDLPRGVGADLMLNDQPWARPVDTRNGNLGLRFAYQLSAAWRATLSANRHEFRRDDYTAFPAGCGALYPGYCANGDYDVYDYQSAGEAKSLRGLQALLNGSFSAAGLRHEFAAGLSSAERRDYYGDYVYELVGSSNLFHPRLTGHSANNTGAAIWRRSDKESAAFAQDIVALSDRLKLHLGLRQLQIQRSRFDGPGYTHSYLLPSLALVLKPLQNWSLYGAYSQGVEHGGSAPFGTANQNQVLDPAKSRQIEVGVKAELSRELSISAAAFRIEKPLEYTDSNNSYVSNGDAVHTGLELAAHGKLSSQLSMGASLTALHARQHNTGLAALDDKRVTNVPDLKSTIYLDYALAQVRGLHLNGSWQYAGSKAFSPDNSVTVPGYAVLNLGARYATSLGGTATTLRFNVDNALDKFYWRDVTQSLGGYLFPGASRTYKLSAQFDF
ncbi:MAG: TonB-dependent siderophore receptor [Burkholderiales bacterium]|nr:TonB-dependent siderophore receptor [Burkholderiales bacterium]